MVGAPSLNVMLIFPGDSSLMTVFPGSKRPWKVPEAASKTLEYPPIRNSQPGPRQVREPSFTVYRVPSGMVAFIVFPSTSVTRNSPMVGCT